MAEGRNDPDEHGESYYGEELLRANWNPVLDLLVRSGGRIRDRSSAPFERELSEEEAAAFLGRIYTSGA